MILQLCRVQETSTGFEVEDNGEGIRAEDLPHVFGPILSRRSIAIEAYRRGRIGARDLQGDCRNPPAARHRDQQ